MKAKNIIIANILITALLLAGFYYAINTYGTQFLSGMRDKNGVTKVINQKVIQENVSEYRKLSETESDVTKAITTVSPSVLQLVQLDTPAKNAPELVNRRWTSLGTAIIVTSDGYIITNRHVVEDTRLHYGAVNANGELFPVSKIRHDPILDLAVLKITDTSGTALSNLPIASFTSVESPVALGQFALVLGGAQSAPQLIASLGTISNKPVVTGISGDVSRALPMYGIDATIIPGNSGGPVLDLQGNVIALTTAMDNAFAKGGWALPLSKELIQTTLSMISGTGTIHRTPLGVNGMNLNEFSAQQLGLKKFQ